MKRLLRGLISVIVVIFLAGCASAHPAESVSGEEYAKPEADDEITLDWYINYSWYNTSWGTNMVSREITEKTGVNINFISPDGSERVNLDALIAADRLPDLVTLGWWETGLTDMVAEGLVYPLNELADRYDAFFWEVADADIINWYTLGDGNVYCYPNSSYSPKDYDKPDIKIASNQTFLVRKDIYEAIGSPDMTTPEGFADAVRAAAEYAREEGIDLIPIGAHEFTETGCDSFDIFLQNFLAIPYEKDGKIYDRYTDAEYKRWLLMFRQLGEEGYLYSDIFIDKRIQMEEKILEGRYFCMIYQRTDLAEQQLKLAAEHPERVYIAVDGPRNSAGDDHTLPGSGINGWTVTLISKNCRYPDRAIKFLSFLMSEEGQKLIALGVEGENYYMEDGKAVLTEETERLMKQDYQAYEDQIGANDTYWMLQDNRMQVQWKPRDEEVLMQMEEWTYPYVCYTGQYDADFEAGSAAYLADREIRHIHGRMLPQLLLASSEEEFEELWESYIRQREEAGIGLVLEENTKQMLEAKERLGIE